MRAEYRNGVSKEQGPEIIKTSTALRQTIANHVKISGYKEEYQEAAIEHLLAEHLINKPNNISFIQSARDYTETLKEVEKSTFLSTILESYTQDGSLDSGKMKRFLDNCIRQPTSYPPETSNDPYQTTLEGDEAVKELMDLFTNLAQKNGEIYSEKFIMQNVFLDVLTTIEAAKESGSSVTAKSLEERISANVEFQKLSFEKISNIINLKDKRKTMTIDDTQLIDLIKNGLTSEMSMASQ